MSNTSEHEHINVSEIRPWGETFPTRGQFKNYTKARYKKESKDFSLPQRKPASMPTPSDIARFCTINWEDIIWSERPGKKPGKLDDTIDYLYNLLDIMRDEERSKHSGIYYDSFEMNSLWQPIHGKHRVAALVLVGPEYIEKSGMNNFMTYKIHLENMGISTYNKGMVGEQQITGEGGSVRGDKIRRIAREVQLPIESSTRFAQVREIQEAEERRRRDPEKARIIDLRGKKVVEKGEGEEARVEFINSDGTPYQRDGATWGMSKDEYDTFVESKEAKSIRDQGKGELKVRPIIGEEGKTINVQWCLFDPSEQVVTKEVKEARGMVHAAEKRLWTERKQRGEKKGYPLVKLQGAKAHLIEQKGTEGKVMVRFKKEGDNDYTHYTDEKGEKRYVEMSEEEYNSLVESSKKSPDSNAVLMVNPGFNDKGEITDLSYFLLDKNVQQVPLKDDEQLVSPEKITVQSFSVGKKAAEDTYREQEFQERGISYADYIRTHNQDYALFEKMKDGTIKVSIADGVSNSTLARYASIAFTETYMVYPLRERAPKSEQDTFRNTVHKRYQELLSTQVLQDIQDTYKPHGDFFIENFLEEEKKEGTQTVPLGAELKGNDLWITSFTSFEHEELPDTCCIVMRDGEVAFSYPITDSLQFDITPNTFFLRSTDESATNMKMKTQHFTVQKGDTIVFATDALAEWILRLNKHGRKQNIKELLSISTANEFKDFSKKYRHELGDDDLMTLLSDDDTTMVKIQL